jgi:hypothetical protein
MIRKRKLGDVPRVRDDTRLNWLRHSRYVSRRALANVITSVQKELVHNPSTTSQFRARKNLASTQTPYGPLVEEVKLENEVSLGISNPLAAMYWSCKHSSSYADIVFSALQHRPPTVDRPWSLILYQDGVDPSDGLAKSHTRKSAVYYTAVAEYGARALGFEHVWLTATLVRVNQIHKIEGDHCRIATLILERMFNPGGIDAERAGFILEFPDGSRHQVYIKLGIVLADEPALKELASMKGHAGTLCCGICKNCVLLRPPGGADSLASHSEYFKSIAEIDLSVSTMFII